MRIEAYNQEKHSPLLVEWLKARNMPVPDWRLLSADTGLCVDGIAIGFLVMPRSGLQAYIDHVAADHTVGPTRRDEALKLLLDALCAWAMKEGYLCVTILGHLPSMRRRLTGTGWRYHGEYGLYFKAGGDLCRGLHP